MASVLKLAVTWAVRAIRFVGLRHAEGTVMHRPHKRGRRERQLQLAARRFLCHTRGAAAGGCLDLDL